MYTAYYTPHTRVQGKQQLRMTMDQEL